MSGGITFALIGCAAALAGQAWLTKAACESFNAVLSKWNDTFRPLERRRGVDRDAARKHLLSQLWAVWQHGVLQRLTIIFPLLGVTITAASLANLKLEAVPATATGTAADGLSFIRLDLFLGVLCGAALALANQVFVMVATRRLHQAVARADELYPEWFQEAPSARLDALVDAISAVTSGLSDRVTGALSAFEKGFTAIASSLDGAAAKLDAAGQKVDVATVSLSNAAEKLSQTLDPVRDQLAGAATDVRANLNTANLSLASQVTAFAETLAAFKDTPRGFVKASGELRATVASLKEDAEGLQAVTAQMAESVRMISGQGPAGLGTVVQQAAERLKVASDGWNESASKVTAAAAALSGVLAPQHAKIVKLSESTAEAVHGVASSLPASIRQLEELHRKTDGRIEDFQKRTDGVSARLVRQGEELSMQIGTVQHQVADLKVQLPTGRSMLTKLKTSVFGQPAPTKN